MQNQITSIAWKGVILLILLVFSNVVYCQTIIWTGSGDHKAGTIELTNMNDEGLGIIGNAWLTIRTGAELNLSSVAQDPFNIDAGATLDCQGIMDIGQ